MPEWAEAFKTQSSDLRIGIDTVWVLVAAMLVFWMNAGFALVESGLCRAKNATNILAKNFIVFAASTISFWVIGWGLMFGDGNAFMGLAGPVLRVGRGQLARARRGLRGDEPVLDRRSTRASTARSTGPPCRSGRSSSSSSCSPEPPRRSSRARWPSASSSARSWSSASCWSPSSTRSRGHWIWGGGWLGASNFRDFAGSTVVHSVGGWAALAGVLVLGPRLGKFGKDGKVNPIPGHSMTSAALGVLILWLGWFGFNPGSTMAAMNGTAIAHILVATNLAAAAGALGATIAAWMLLGKPDLSMILNGCLAGLVAITAPCAFVTIALGGADRPRRRRARGRSAVLAFDKVKIDDPVGALSVHLVNGIWGTLALGLFYDNDVATNIAALATGLSRGAQTMVQLKGIVSVGAFTFAGLARSFWYAIKVTMGVRVSRGRGVRGSRHRRARQPGVPGLRDAPRVVRSRRRRAGPGEADARCCSARHREDLKERSR